MAQETTLLDPEIPSSVAWRIWLRHMLLALGTVLVLASVIYFFAYNWNSLRPSIRFALVEGGFVLCVAAALTTMVRSPRAADVALAAAAALTGVFWAVFGQIYQTGADAWQLFALWTVCVTPWLALRPSAAQWTVWLAVGNIALGLWTAQSGLFPARGVWGGWFHDAMRLYFPTIAANAALWAACLAAERLRPAVGDKARLFGLIVLPFLLVASCLPVCDWLAESSPAWRHGQTDFSLAAAGGATALAATALYAWRARKAGRVLPLFMAALCGFPLLNCALLHIVNVDSFGSILGLYTAANLGYTLLAARGLSPRRVSAPPATRPEPSTSATSVTSATSGPAPEADEKISVLSMALGGLGGTLSALLLTALTAWLLEKLGGGIFPRMLYAAAPFLLAGAVTARGRGSFRRTLSLILSGAGFTFLAFAIIDAWSMEAAALAVATATLALYPLHRHAEWRFTAVACALIFLLTALHMAAPHTLSTPARWMLIRGILFLCGLSTVRLAWRRTPAAQALTPALYAAWLTLALYLPDWSPLYAAGSWSRSEFTADIPFLPSPFHFSLFSLVFGMTLLMLLLREARGRLNKAQLGAALAGLAVLLALVPASVLYALTLIFLGRARRVKGLVPLGMVLLGIYLVGYYSTLRTSFLRKTLSIGAPGVILLLGAGLLTWPRENRAGERPAASRPRQPGAARWRLAAVAVMLATLGAFQYAIFDKERLLATGDTLLLPLAPVDPRSLMQGDYMALRYRLEDDLRYSEGPLPARGWVLVRKNRRGVGLMAGIVDTPENLKPDEYAVPFRRDRGGSNFFVLRLPGSFLFQEGHGSYYENAEYGVLRCAPAGGGCLLTGLADANGRILGKENAPR